ncbi:MAG: two-component system, cell cycle response regulator [Clostridiales bacterium]|nr:two-component system, cell cycle response regulator [Clostridiales bacterium]
MENTLEELLREVEKRLSIFPGLYHYIRVVEPVKKISYIQPEHLPPDKDPESGVCYQFWNAARQCENCISIRAYNQNKPAIKIEVKEAHTYLIQAFPIEWHGERYVAEMIKDITDDDFLFSQSNAFVDFGEYVKTMNLKAVQDDLTGVYNRRYVDERLPVELAKAREIGASVTVVMADVDHFKEINDTYGHLIGDCVLKGLAEIMKTSVRASTDWVARYGGEEFIIVLNRVTCEKAFEITEKIRKKIEAYTFECGQHHIRLTCSFGIHVISENVLDAGGAIEPADTCLYQAKQRGRNRSVLYGE